MALIITLIAIGLLLLAIELLITPGFGLPGILGLVSIIGSVVLSFIEYGHTTGLIVLGVVIVILSVCTWLILRSNTWKNISLKESISSRTGSSPQDKGLTVGIKGVAISRLSPSGKARFNSHDIEVWSQSGVINNGTLIEIVDIDGRKITVKQKE
ncbi:MAG: NfeD family protein [Bacteroidales bacterium]|nr:NfeD family protein [Bacteroidales bacterium]MDD4655971.1 NfeD family protein [Bacteroidales bacterium]